MKFLTLSDCKSLGLTCHRMHSVFLDSNIHQNVAILLHARFASGMEILKNARFNTYHLVLKDIQFKKDSVQIWNEFWRKAKCNLISLALYNCEILERAFVEVLQLCVNLRVLLIVGCDSLFMSGNFLNSENDLVKAKDALMNVKELSLANNRYLSDSLFSRIVSVTPNIEKLSLASCEICFNPAIYRRFYPRNRVNSESQNVFTLEHIMMFLSKQSQRIKSLDFSRTAIDTNSLIAITNLPNFHHCLQELFLASCGQLKVGGILTTLRNQKSLKTLDLSNCVTVNDTIVIAICESLKEMKNLQLWQCHTITDQGVAELKSLTNLCKLNLSGCDKITTEGIRIWLNDNGLIQLYHLDFGACTFNDEAILLICDKLVTLQHLDLSSCRLAMNDRALQAINRNLIYLRTLDLAWCSNISDHGLGISDHSEIAEADIANRDNVARSKPCSISNLRGLNRLSLSACINVTDEGVKETLHFSELRTLNLSMCKYVRDAALISIGAQIPSLETLIISQCLDITDEGISRMLTRLGRLKHLDVQGCKLLTDNCLLVMPQSCPDLQFLDVSICFGITQEGVDRLEKNMKSLHTIHKRHINPTTFNL